MYTVHKIFSCLEGSMSDKFFSSDKCLFLKLVNEKYQLFIVHA